MYNVCKNSERGIKMSLYQYLVEKKNYSENDAEETAIRVSADMELPSCVIKDIEDYYHYIFSVR